MNPMLMFQLGAGLLSLIGNKRQQRQYEEQTQEQIDETLGSLEQGYQRSQRATRTGRQDVMGLLNQNEADGNNRYYWQGTTSPGGWTSGNGVRGARRRADGSTPQDYSLGTGNVGTGSIADVEKILAGGGSVEDAIAAFNGPGVPDAPAGEEVFNPGLDIINSLEQRKADAFGYLDKFGTGARQDIETSYYNAGQQIDQNMIDRGLYSTSTAGSLQSGLARDKAKSLTDLDERVNTLKAEAGTKLDADIIAAKDMQRQEANNQDWSQFSARLGSVMDFLGMDLNQENNYWTNRANVWQGMNIMPPDRNEILGLAQGIGSSFGMQQYSKWLEDQQTLFGGMGGSIGQSLGLLGGGLAGIANPSMALPYALIGGSAGYGLGAGFDR